MLIYTILFFCDCFWNVFFVSLQTLWYIRKPEMMLLWAAYQDRYLSILRLYALNEQNF